ncbi:MAG: Gfo/Idh/MocA family oxidoreductase [Myxococcota bacterium]
MPAPFRWGLLGAGTISRRFGRSLAQAPGHRVVAVASRTAARAEALARDFGATARTEYAALVERPDVDAVYVGTPTALHAAHARLGLEAGRPVLCEKPLATSAEDARALTALARSQGVFLMEAMWTRFLPAVRATKAALERGDLGEVQLFQAELGYRVPYDPTSRFFARELGGGALLDAGVYPLSLAFHLLGPPVSGHALVDRAPTGVDRTTLAQLRHAGGAMASIACSFAERLRNDALLVGEKGRLAIGAPLYGPTAYRLERAAAPASGGEDAPPPRWKEHPAVETVLRRVRPLARHARSRPRVHDFLGAGYHFEALEVATRVREGALESPTMPLDESVQILETIDALLGPGHFGERPGHVG